MMESQMSIELVPPLGGNSSPPDAAAQTNHLIANSLARMASLARIYGSSICKNPRMMSGEEVRLLLEEFGGRLQVVAGLHRLLAELPEASIAIADYLQDIAESVVSSLSFAGENELQFACDPGCRVPPERALSIGLIVCELVTNAVKYAHPTGVTGHIRIACRRHLDGSILLEVSDDGVGLPEGVNLMKNGLLGFRLVRSLVQHIDAKIEVHDDGLGLCFMLQVPGPMMRPLEAVQC
jgi:two-component sensor histidine kinase